MKLERNAFLAKIFIKVFLGNLPEDSTFNELILRLSKKIVKALFPSYVYEFCDLCNGHVRTFQLLINSILLQQEKQNIPVCG